MSDFRKRKELEEFRNKNYEVKMPEWTMTIEADNICLLWDYVKWLEAQIKILTE